MAHATSEPPPLAPLALHGLSVEGVNQCVHCGLCLAYCPTFAELGTEMDSPRGRIFLIKSLAEGRIGLSDPTVEHLSLCLDCRACETACPSGVPYGRLIEAAKAEIERQRPGGPVRRAFRWVNFGLLLGPSAHAGGGGDGAPALPGQRPADACPALRPDAAAARHTAGVGSADALDAARRASGPRSRRSRKAEGARRGRVALLTGCVQSIVFGAHNRATARVLARNGWDVVAPSGQGCCGALNAHGGDHARAIAMAKATIATFEAAQADAVIVNTSGCGAHMKAFGNLLAGEAGWAQRAAAFAATVQDLAEFLAREPLRGPLRPQPMTVTYHDPCHVVHGQKIRRQPRALLAQLPGVRVVDLPESDWCCGSAGIYNLTQPEMADRLLRRKTRNIESTRADAVVTANPGCILQIQAGLRARDLDLPVLHLVELLDRAYGGETS